MTREELMEQTINAIADMMRIGGTIEEKCERIRKVFGVVGRMMPDIKCSIDEIMKKQNGGSH